MESFELCALDGRDIDVDAGMGTISDPSLIAMHPHFRGQVGPSSAGGERLRSRVNCPVEGGDETGVVVAVVLFKGQRKLIPPSPVRIVLCRLKRAGGIEAVYRWNC